MRVLQRAWLIGGGLVAVWLVWVSYVLTWGWGKLP